MVIIPSPSDSFSRAGSLKFATAGRLLFFRSILPPILPKESEREKKKKSSLFSRFGGVSNRVKIFSSFQRCGGASFIRFSFDGRSNTNSHARPSSYFALRYCSRRGKKAKSDLIHRFKIFLLERSERKLHAHKIVFSNGSEH